MNRLLEILEFFVATVEVSFLENTGTMRNVRIIRERKGEGVLNRQIRERIEKRLQQKERVIVFICRRGYAPFLVCSVCSYIPRCTHCDIALAFHKKEEKLICHYCQYSLPQIKVCPECKNRIIKKRGVYNYLNWYLYKLYLVKVQIKRNITGWFLYYFCLFMDCRFEKDVIAAKWFRLTNSSFVFCMCLI